MKGKKARQFLGVLFLLVICGFFATKKVDVMAYSSTLQKGQTQNSITVSWEKPTYYNVTGYKLYLSKDYSDVSKRTPISLNAGATSYTFQRLSAGTQYYVQIEYEYTTSYGGPYTSTLRSGYVTTLPGKVTGVKQDRWWRYALSVDATWTKQSGVSGYQYIIRDSRNKIKKNEKSTYGTRADCKIKNNMLYTLTVRAYTDINGKKYYGAWSDKAYLFTQPEISKLSIKGKKLTVKWKKISGVTGYDVYVSTKKNKGYKKVKAVNAKKSSVTVTKVKKAKINKKKTYYVYVVAKKKVGKRIYGSGVNYISIIKKGKFTAGDLNYIQK